MTTFSQRFGVGDPLVRRSSEWLVMWKSTASDVYVAARSLGGMIKASIHQSGVCHIRAPSVDKWQGAGPAPRFLQTWKIDPAAAMAFPFRVIIPHAELRAADWGQHRDKGTVWLPVDAGESVEVAIFLIRSRGDYQQALIDAGWTRPLLDEVLPDGRRLLVAAGRLQMPAERQAEIERLRRNIGSKVDLLRYENPRIVLVSGDDANTRAFVEIAAVSTPEAAASGADDGGRSQLG